MSQAVGATAEVGWDDLDSRWLVGRAGSKWQRRPDGVLPAWIAEMDFPVAAPIVDAMRELAGTAVLGYPDWSDGTPLRATFADRMAARYGWQVDPGEVREFDTVTQAAHVMVRLATEPGDAIAVHTPGYGPLWSGILSAGRRPVAVPMRSSSTGWGFDVEEFERRVREAGCRVLLLVNPHNPTGRVFTRAELHQIAGIAERHGLLVIADEVHADLVYAPHEHVPFAALDSEVTQRTVTIASASKAFNISGTRCAVTHVGPRWLRARLDHEAVELFGAANLFGVAATQAAWTQCDGWLKSTVDYLDVNRRLVSTVLTEQAPAVGYHVPEGTYLAWLDCRALGWTPEPAEFLLDRGRVKLSPGPSFDPGGDGFVRLNFATSHVVLVELLRRIVRCVAEEGNGC